MQFDFGQNWADFSEHAITPERIAQARADFATLMEGIDLADHTFLDIGFGQGFGLLTAATMGAGTLGCDIDPECGEVLSRNRQLFPELAGKSIDVIIGSILDDEVVRRLRAHPAFGRDGFDVVHSWGVLHHTGDMRRAIGNAGSLVRAGGHFVIAIYNRHWSSQAWLWIKWGYCKSPRWVQKLMIAGLYPIIWLAKFLLTGENPKDKERGMDFFYDVVDWVGGYPYEYASIEEIEEMCRPLGLELVDARRANVPTGCNEFVFIKRATTHVTTGLLP
jgi:2-polyprenyl-6-hydroxyphenyl methylase/3-demethylubiquinone-9 3-methyltransferase